MADVSDGLVRGRPRLGWMDGVKAPLGTEERQCEGGLSSIARQCAKDRKEWRALVHM